MQIFLIWTNDWVVERFLFTTSGKVLGIASKYIGYYTSLANRLPRFLSSNK